MIFKNRSRVFRFIVLAGLLLFLGCTGKGDTDRPAPDFLLEDLSARGVSLKQSKGSVVLLDFWATWCPPCLRSIPELVDIQAKYRDRGLVIIGISVDDPSMISNGDLLAFKDRLRINYPIVRADTKVLKNYFSNAEDMAIPTMFIIDRDGRIIEKKVGFRPGVLEESLKKVLS
ncbi:MAG: TlpA family protein disulfide reductase [Desulfobacterales bacterium]|nr:TlpA family protein disulfide reductase [Desulfobacterales bacterium]